MPNGAPSGMMNVSPMVPRQLTMISPPRTVNRCNSLYFFSFIYRVSTSIVFFIACFCSYTMQYPWSAATKHSFFRLLPKGPMNISTTLSSSGAASNLSASPNSSINRDWQSANVFSMGNLHIVLIHHCVLHCGVNFGMAEEPLHLFYRHSFVDGACRQRSSELMWMHLCDA